MFQNILKYLSRSTLSLLPIALMACSQSPVEHRESRVQIAEPRAFSITADDLLGVNESGKGRPPGHPVADFSLKDIQGNDYAINQSWQDQPALVVFYRGGWCPFCNMQVRELSENHQKLVDAGVQPVLISVDEPDKTAMLSAQYSIPFPVLSDPDLTAHREFNVVLELDEATLSRYEEYGIELAAWSGMDHNAIAVASVFIVGTKGEILLSHAPEDYSARPSIDQLLMMIERVK